MCFRTDVGQDSSSCGWLSTSYVLWPAFVCKRKAGSNCIHNRLARSRARVTDLVIGFYSVYTCTDQSLSANPSFFQRAFCPFFLQLPGSPFFLASPAHASECHGAHDVVLDRWQTAEGP